MAMTEEAIETLEYLKEKHNAEEIGVLNDWESGFLRDQLQRFAQYGDQTRFSEKQWAIVLRIEKLLVEGLRPARK